MRRVCVFCGSSEGRGPEFSAAASALAREIARRGWGLVYGGGKIGLMRVLADAALRAGGEVIGVIPQALVERELAHRAVTELRIVGSMHERKALMADLSDAFVALPGGYGTLDEFCEVLTWAQLGFHGKPCGLLNVGGFYEPFLKQVETAVRSGFVRPEQSGLVLVETTPTALLDRLQGGGRRLPSRGRLAGGAR